MDEKEVNDAVEFLKQHTAMSEHEAMFRMVKTVTWGAVIIILALVIGTTSCGIYEYKMAFENGYEKGVLPGSNSSYWVKSKEKQ